MALIKKQRKASPVKEEVEIKKLKEMEENLNKIIEEKKNNTEEKIKDLEETVKTTGENVDKVKPKSIKKGSKVIANGRCFGASSLECPLKTVRHYETKVLDIDKGHNSVLIDEGWISKDFVE